MGGAFGKWVERLGRGRASGKGRVRSTAVGMPYVRPHGTLSQVSENSTLVSLGLQGNVRAADQTQVEFTAVRLGERTLGKSLIRRQFRI